MSSKRLAFSRLSVLLLATLACGQGRTTTLNRKWSGDAGGACGRVGQVVIPGSLLAGAARVRGVPKRLALDDLLADALLAQGARDRRLDRVPAIEWASVVSMARVVLSRLDAEARARGAPTAEELAIVRVVQAVVRRSRGVQPDYARAIAEAIARQTQGAMDLSAFDERAARVAHGSLQVAVEQLPDFDASGRTADGSEIDPTLVAAAFAIRTNGQTSDVVETPLGWHAMCLLARIAPSPQSIERERPEVVRRALTMRVRADLGAALLDKRQRTLVTISAAAEDLMTEAGAGEL